MKRIFDKKEKSSELFTCTHLTDKYKLLKSWFIMVKIDDTCICPNHNKEIILENFNRMRYYL